MTAGPKGGRLYSHKKLTGPKGGRELAIVVCSHKLTGPKEDDRSIRDNALILE